MNKKIIALIVGVVIILLVGIGVWMINSNTNNESSSNNLSTGDYEESSSSQVENNTSNEEGNSNDGSSSKTDIVYFSASGTTKGVAEVIGRVTGGELIEIVPKEKYTSADLDWNDSKSRTSIECNDKNSRPEIANTMNVDDYDVIYLGYPIWWGDVPHIILTFMDTYQLDGKTVIPFCTSGGTGIGGSISTLKNYNKNVHWIDGKRLTKNENEIKNWVNSLNI